MLTLLRFILKVLFRFRAHGLDSLKTKGPVLLIPNHVSWLDWLFIGVVLEEDWRFVTSSAVSNTSWVHRKIMVNRRTFPIDATSPYAVRTMADYLATGGRLVLFAEGRITTTGALMKLFEGTGFLIQKTRAKVITCHLSGAERLKVSKHPGWKKWFPSVELHVGPALEAPTFANEHHSKARVMITNWLRDTMVEQQFKADFEHGPANMAEAIRQTAANIPGATALEDISFTPLSYRRMIVGGRLLAQALPETLPAGGRVGLLLPNVSATPILLLALWARSVTPAILNFSSGMNVMLDCSKLAGLRQVLSSRTFAEKAKLDLSAFTQAGIEVLYLEDLRSKIGGAAKLLALLKESLGLAGDFKSCATREDTAVVLFTSGSEGTPKGVELSHANLLANVRQSVAMMDLRDNDVFFNALPLFHSFGLTAGTLLPLVRGCSIFLHPSPLHYRSIPALIYDKGATVLLGTNTFLNGYARKAHAYDFNSLRYLVAGAEKVQDSTFETYARRFGVRILEGYGATECSPVIAVNSRVQPLVGTAGRFLPGMEHKLETIEGVSTGGRLLVKGPNVMKGYLNPEANAKFKELQGWYDTGDIVTVDSDGFIRIQGRMKRFAKVSGEMVSLTAVEDALNAALRARNPRFEIAVTSIPDTDKGEMLIAVSNDSLLTLAEVRAAVRSYGLSNLCAPRSVLFQQKLPKLGTGKADYRKLTEIVNSEISAKIEA